MANTGSIAEATLERLERPRSLTEMVITQIRELIVSGRLALGEQLIRKRAGRTTRRQPHAGPRGLSQARDRASGGSAPATRHVRLSGHLAELRDICELRESSRRALCASPCRAIETDSNRAPGAVRQTQPKTARVVDPALYQTFDNSFHYALVKASANEELIEAYERISGRVRAIRYRLTRSRRQIIGSQRGHREIVKALKEGRDAGRRAKGSPSMSTTPSKCSAAKSQARARATPGAAGRRSGKEIIE